MAGVVFVHGIGPPRQSAKRMAEAWLDAQNTGAGATRSAGLSKDDVVPPYYHHAFAAPDSTVPDGDEVAVADLDVVELAMVDQLWAAAVVQTPALAVGGTKAEVPLSVQERVKRMSGWNRSRTARPRGSLEHPAGVALPVDPGARERVQAVVRDAVTERTWYSQAQSWLTRRA